VKKSKPLIAQESTTVYDKESVVVFGSEDVEPEKHTKWLVGQNPKPGPVLNLSLAELFQGSPGT
jgi:hypothetical protein